MMISCEIRTKHRQKSVRRDAPERPDSLLRAHGELEPGWWVQKRRQTDPDSGEPAYQDPRKAVAVAINAKFSLIAIGTYGYVIPIADLTRSGLVLF